MCWMRFSAVLLAILGFSLAGCGSQTTSHDAASQFDHAHDGHSHGEDGHSHDHGHTHTHATHGPNGGHLIELGADEFHAELAHDADHNTVTVFILAADAATPALIDAEKVTLNLVADGSPRQFHLTASPLAQETAKKCSRFTLQSTELVKLLVNDGHVHGRLNVTIDENPYVGTIDHDDCGDPDHDHAHDDGQHAHRETSDASTFK